MEPDRLQLFLWAAVVLTSFRIARPFYKRYKARRFESEREEHEATWRSIQGEESDGDENQAP